MPHGLPQFGGGELVNVLEFHARSLAHVPGIVLQVPGKGRGNPTHYQGIADLTFQDIGHAHRVHAGVADLHRPASRASGPVQNSRKRP